MIEGPYVRTAECCSVEGLGLRDARMHFAISLSCFIWGEKREGERSIVMSSMLLLSFTVPGQE